MGGSAEKLLLKLAGKICREIDLRDHALSTSRVLKGWHGACYEGTPEKEFEMFGDLRGEVKFFETAMNLRVQRQQIIASNIANADTPHYKAKDFDFSQALQSAMYGKQEGDVSLAKTSSRHIDGVNGAGNGMLKFRTEKQSAVDGNTVDMDTERSAMAENSIQYEVLTKLISDKFSGMRAAIASNQG